MQSLVLTAYKPEVRQDQNFPRTDQRGIRAHNRLWRHVDQQAGHRGGRQIIEAIYTKGGTMYGPLPSTNIAQDRDGRPSNPGAEYNDHSIRAEHLPTSNRHGRPADYCSR